MHSKLKTSQIQAMLNGSKEALVLLDEHFQTIFQTNSAELITGWSDEHAKTNKVLDKVHPDDFESLKKAMADVLNSPSEPITITFRALHKNKSYIWLKAVMTNYLHDKNVSGIVANFEDISAQREHEKKQILYNFVLNLSGDAILSKDLNNIITGWNKGAEKEFGYTANEVIGKHISILIPPYLKGEETHLTEKIKNGEVIDQYKTDRLTKSGTIIHVSLTISPIKDTEGNIIGASKISRNITESKKTEEELKVNNKALADYKYALDVSSIVAITDQKGIINFVNDNFCKISKYSYKELIGQDHRIISSGYHSKEFIKGLWRTIANGNVWKGELKNKAKDGTYYWVDTTIVPFVDENNKPFQYLSIRADITERKKNEEELKVNNKALADYKYALDVSSIVAITDQKGIINFVNDNFCKISKYSHKELIGQDHRIISSGYHSKEFIKGLWRTIANGNVWKGELKNKAKDGTYYWVDTTIVPFVDENNKPFQYLSIRADITERKKVEEEASKMNRLYTFLSAINQCIVHTKDEMQLLHRCQQIAIEQGKFVEATIGILNGDGILINIDSNDYKHNETISLNHTDTHVTTYSLHKIPIGKVLATGTYAVINDVLNDPDLVLWKDEMKYRNIYSCAIFPIKKFDRIIGVFTFYSSELHFFDAKEISLLNEAVNDISFSFEVFEKEKLQQMAEKAMERSEANYKSIMERAGDGILVIDQKGNCLDANTSLFQLTGYNLQEILTLTISQLVPETDLGIQQQQLQRLLAGENLIVEKTLKKKDGSLILTEMNANVFPDGRLLAIFRNISERKLAEEKIKVSEANLAAIIENANANIYSLDTELRYVAFNSLLKETLHQVYGLTIRPGDLVYGFLEKLAPDEAKEWEGIYREALKGKSIKFEKEFTINDYHSFISFSINPIFKNDQLIGLSCFARDITEKKVIEQKIINSEKHIRNFANHLNQIQEDERAHIAREIHDELGQQLVGIKIGISALSGKKQHHDAINGLLKDVDGTIQSVRKIATELRPGILDSLGLVPSIQWLLKGFEKKTGIKCNVFLDLEEQWFEKDLCTNFFRIVQEALTNITKHANASEIIVEMYYTDQVLSIKITDNGKGMANDKLENPFSVGLLGMRERARIIGGDLQIISKQNEGTSVVLSVKIK